MEDAAVGYVLEFIKFFLNLPSIIQVLVIVPILVYLGFKYHGYMEFKTKRRSQTNTTMLSHTDTVLRNILSESIQNMRDIMIESRGGAANLTQDDKTELQTCRTSATVSLLVEAKESIKSFYQINGYVAKIRAGIDISGIITERATELRDKSADIIDSVVRSSSPLYNNSDLRFSKDKGIDLYRSLVDFHYKEVQLEELEVNAYVKSNFGFLSKFLKYVH